MNAVVLQTLSSWNHVLEKAALPAPESLNSFSTALVDAAETTPIMADSFLELTQVFSDALKTFVWVEVGEIPSIPPSLFISF